MKENQTNDNEVKVKRKSWYYIVVAACALVLVAAIVLTVVFVAQDNTPAIENPNNPDDGAGTEEPEDPGDNDDDDDDDDDSNQSGNTEIVFSMPVSGGTIGTMYTFWYNSTLNRYNLHDGIDFKADAGTSVGAAYAGTVESITDTLLEGGKVVIDHGNGLKSEYASIDVVAGLQVGDSVAQGEVIGTVSAAADVMGNEYNEGAHLHFEVTQDGKSIDPASYLDLDEK